MKVSPRISGRMDGRAAYKQVNENMEHLELPRADTVYLRYPDTETSAISVLEVMDGYGLYLRSVTQTQGILRLTDEKIGRILVLAHKWQTDLIRAIAPRATTDIFVCVHIEEGVYGGYRCCGQTQVVRIASRPADPSLKCTVRIARKTTLANAPSIVCCPSG